MVSELWLGMWSGVAGMWGIPTAGVALIMAFVIALVVAMGIGFWSKNQQFGLVTIPLFLFIETFLGLVDWVVFIVILIVMAAAFGAISKVSQ